MASASNDNRSKSSFLGKTGSDQSPIDRTFYNVLNVSPTASNAEIKKAYYSLSLQYHPDRTQDLDEMTRREYSERFKTISNAYGILSDPEKRSLYNKYGRDERVLASDSFAFSMESFDPEEFFRLMFGGEDFQSIIGNFELAKTFKSAVSEMVNENDRNQPGFSDAERRARRLAEMEDRRQAREERINILSINLVEKLNNFTNICPVSKKDPLFVRAVEEFTNLIRIEMNQLINAPYGENLLHSIGYIYSAKARLWSTKMDTQENSIKKKVIGQAKHLQSSCQDRAHVVRETFKTLKSAVKWGQSVSRLAQATEDDTDDESNQFHPNSTQLEYSGTVTHTETVRTKTKRKSSSQPPVPLTQAEKQELEADMAAKSMQALWQAVKLEIESVQRAVCDRVLTDPMCDREMLRSRCFALSKIGEIWQGARIH